MMVDEKRISVKSRSVFEKVLEILEDWGFKLEKIGRNSYFSNKDGAEITLEWDERKGEGLITIRGDYHGYVSDIVEESVEEAEIELGLRVRVGRALLDLVTTSMIMSKAASHGDFELVQIYAKILEKCLEYIRENHKELVDYEIIDLVEDAVGRILEGARRKNPQEIVDNTEYLYDVIADFISDLIEEEVGESIDEELEEDVDLGTIEGFDGDN